MIILKLKGELNKMRYYSDELNKFFDSEKDLKIAEDENKEKLKQKQELSKIKKQDAEKVEEALKLRNQIVKSYNNKLIECRKEYNKQLLKLQRDFDTTVKELEKELEKADDDYNKALKEFTAKHPEGYHMTIRDGDNFVFMHNLNSTDLTDFQKMYSAMDNLLDSIFNNF